MLVVTRILLRRSKFVFSNNCNTLCASNVLPSQKIIVRDATKKAPLYIKRDHEYKVTKKGAIKTLEELFQLRTFAATEIVDKFKQFSTVNKHTITTNYNLYLDHGIHKSTILKNPEILTFLGDVELKINELKKLPFNINHTIPLINLDLSKIRNLVQRDPVESRIKTLSVLLKTSIYETCVSISERPFLIGQNLERIKQNVLLLKEHGVRSEQIQNDWWVLKYSPQHIKSRLKYATENNVDIVKTWMIRAQPTIFDTYVRRRSDNKLILGNHSLVEYLSELLNCSEDNVKYLIQKHPAIRNKSLKKIEEMTQFLYSEGFKPFHICRVPKILLHSVETTRKRLKELESQGMKLDSLYMLTKSQKQYMQYCDALTKTNKNKLQSLS